MGNKPSRNSLPPPASPAEGGKNKKKSEKSKKASKMAASASEERLKSNGTSTATRPAASYSSSTLFRPPRSETDGQLSQVILPDQELEIKVYKKSRDTLNDNFDRSRRYRSLPRSRSAGFRKSTDTLLSCESKQTERPNQRCPSFAQGNTSFTSGRWSYLNGNESPSFRPPAGLKGVTFPAEEIISRNTSLFERTYVEFFVDHYYASLPDVVKVSAVIIAYKRIYGVGEVDYRPISLREYFVAEDEQDVPRNLLSPEAKKLFIPAVPEAMLAELVPLRGRGTEDNWEESQIRVAVDLARHVTTEAARELSRIYEYQVSSVSDVASVQILGRHAAERSAEYLRNGNRFVERDALVEGTAYLPAPSASHRNSFGSSRSQSPGIGFVSAIFGEEREQRWEVSHVFASCGLRLDGGDPIRRVGSSWPVFLTTRDALPLVYGYRSPIFKKDFETGTENISQTELGLYPDVLPDDPNDFHRDYIPSRVAFSNRSSSFDSQSVGSLCTDPRRHEADARSGRFGRQSNAVHAQAKVVGRASMRTSTLASNAKYGSLARSVDFDADQTHAPPNGRSFQRNVPAYQSERTPMSGGRLPGYPTNRPERISINEGNNYDRGTMRRNNYNGYNSYNNYNNNNNNNGSINGSISSLNRQMHGEAPQVITGDAFNHRSMRPPMDHPGKFSRLPPKPPVRSTSQYSNGINNNNSHYYHHNNAQNSYGTLPIHSAIPVMTNHFQPFQSKLPPTTETSFDCNVEEDVPAKAPPPVAVVDSKPSEGNSDFMLDFQSFLKLVECQNANLKNLDLNSSIQPSKPSRGGGQLETDFPDVEAPAAL